VRQCLEVVTADMKLNEAGAEAECRRQLLYTSTAIRRPIAKALPMLGL
jgi:hypothetical protein